MSSQCNAIITLRTQNEDSTINAIEALTHILNENSNKVVKVFDNPYALIAALNPENPEYVTEFVYIYTGKIASYNIENWTKTLCGVFNNSIRCPTFYFYRYGLSGAGISTVGCKINLHPNATAKDSLSHFFGVYDNLSLGGTGCNRNFDVLCPDINNQLTVALKSWDII